MYMTVAPLPARRARGLRGLGQFDILYNLLPAALTPAPTPRGADLTTTDLLWNWVSSGGGISEGCYPWDITCANRQAMIQSGQAKIQNVADNAAYYYGADSTTAQVAQQMADQQKALVPQDVATITAANLPVGPMGIPTWLWIAAGGLGLWFFARR
jgi:hypothetical protein